MNLSKIPGSQNNCKVFVSYPTMSCYIPLLERVTILMHSLMLILFYQHFYCHCVSWLFFISDYILQRP